MKSLSVVVPTLNCAKGIPAHLDSMRQWLDLASEIVVVDSHSDDDTPELIRDGLQHPNLRILSHPRGLYPSWNFGIAQTTGDWIYISTIGDTITRAHLEHLLEVGDELGSDVVVSQPTFTYDEHIEMEPPIWPIAHLLDFHRITKPTEISPCAALYHAARFIPDAILGSSASNLYCGEHLRQRPFPSMFKSAGDTAWTLQYRLETRYCFTPNQGSSFCFHRAHYAAHDPEYYEQLCESMHALVRQMLAAVSPTPEWATVSGMMEETETLRQRILAANRQLKNIRRASLIPWYFRKQALQYRAYRNRLVKQHRRIITRNEEMIRQLPTRALG